MSPGFGLERFGRPGLQAPVFVVDKDAAVLDRGRAQPAVSGRHEKVDCRSGVTSAHQYHGETPIACDNSKTPKAVPRRSLPAITKPNFDVRQRITHVCDHETLPLAAQLFDVEFARADQ